MFPLRGHYIQCPISRAAARFYIWRGCRVSSWTLRTTGVYPYSCHCRTGNKVVIYVASFVFLSWILFYCNRTQRSLDWYFRTDLTMPTVYLLSRITLHSKTDLPQDLCFVISHLLNLSFYVSWFSFVVLNVRQMPQIADHNCSDANSKRELKYCHIHPCQERTNTLQPLWVYVGE